MIERLLILFFYCALLLKKDIDAPIWIPLFEQSQLDSLLIDDLRIENSIQNYALENFDVSQNHNALIINIDIF